MKHELKDGDMVYYPRLFTKPLTVRRSVLADITELLYPFEVVDEVGRVVTEVTSDGCVCWGDTSPIVFPATEEVHRALKVLYPDVEFETPPTKPITCDEIKETAK